MAENAPAAEEQPKTKGRFEPKVPVKLDPPKDDPISLEYLAKCDGTTPGYPTLVAIKGIVFDVTGNKAYGPDGGYKSTHELDLYLAQFHGVQQLTKDTKVFAGHDASRALAKTSLKAEDVLPEWEDLPESEINTLNDWYTFFSKRYNIVGVVEGATNRG